MNIFISNTLKGIQASLYDIVLDLSFIMSYPECILKVSRFDVRYYSRLM